MRLNQIMALNNKEYELEYGGTSSGCTLTIMPALEKSHTKIMTLTLTLPQIIINNMQIPHITSYMCCSISKTLLC